MALETSARTEPQEDGWFMDTVKHPIRSALQAVEWPVHAGLWGAKTYKNAKAVITGNVDDQLAADEWDGAYSAESYATGRITKRDAATRIANDITNYPITKVAHMITEALHLPPQAAAVLGNIISSYAGKGVVDMIAGNEQPSSTLVSPPAGSRQPQRAPSEGGIPMSANDNGSLLSTLVSGIVSGPSVAAPSVPTVAGLPNALRQLVG